MEQVIEPTPSAHPEKGPTPPADPSEKIIFKERVNLGHLRTIIANYEILEKRHKEVSDVPERLVEGDVEQGKEKDVPKLLEKMLLASRDQGDGTCLIPVKYRESKKRREAKITGGRLYAENGVSLQTVKKWVRHTLCHDLYHDVDMVNAHPTLLLQLLEKEGYEDHFPTLRRVVQCRQDLFRQGEQHGFRNGEVKKFILKLMYGGNVTPKETLEALPWLEDLKKEFRLAANIVGQKGEYRDIYEAVRKEALHGRENADLDEYTKRNILFKVVSHALHDIENTILKSCLSFLGARGVSIDEVVLCFDGFMVPRKEIEEVGKEWLEALSVWVKEKTTWQLAFLEKQMDQKADLTGLDATSKIYSIESDVHACEMIQQAAGEIIAYRAEGQLFSKSPTTGKWQTGRDNFTSNIQYYCRKLDLRNNKGEKYSHNANGMRNITAVFEAREDPEFPDRLDQACRQKVFWSDGVFDFTTMQFRKVEPGDMTAVSVPRKYPTEVPSKEKLDEIERKLFLEPLGEEEGRTLLRMLARAAAGHTEDKRWHVILGDRNSGKGAMEKGIRGALGSEYVGTYNIKAFRESTHADDAEYELKWVYGLRWNRLVFSNESIGKDGKLDGNLIKQLVSGGDPIRLRVPHGMPFSIVPQCTFVNNANEVSAVSSRDALETCVMFHCRTKFVDPKTYNSKPEEERPPFWRVGDPILKQSLETEEMKNIVWHILLRHYCKNKPELPESMEQEVAMMQQDESDSIDSIIERVFEITGRESDFEKSSVIDDAWRAYAKDFSLSKMRSKLKQHHDAKKGWIVRSSMKRIDGAPCRGWQGIRIRPGFIDEEDRGA